MSSPRCSVVIPTCDCLHYLRHALASVRMQEIEDIEIIIVDDGSTDGTWEWLAQEQIRDPRIVTLRLDHKGPSTARNHAIAIARAPLVAMIDADDLWWPEKLAKQLAYHEENPDVALSFTDYVHVDMAGRLHGTCFEFWKPGYAEGCGEGFNLVPDAEAELLAANVVGTSTVVASLRALQIANGFATSWNSAEDWNLWLKLASIGQVAFSPAVTMSYLMRPNSHTRNRERRIRAMRAIVSPYESRPDKRIQAACRRAKARIDIAEAEYSREIGARWAAAGAHLRALLRQPDLRTARAALVDIAAGCLGEGRTS